MKCKNGGGWGTDLNSGHSGCQNNLMVYYTSKEATRNCLEKGWHIKKNTWQVIGQILLSTTIYYGLTSINQSRHLESTTSGASW